MNRTKNTEQRLRNDQFSSYEQSELASTATPATSSFHQMVPITYELLQEHYARFPSPSIDPQLQSLQDSIATMRNSLLVTQTQDVSNCVNDIMAETLPVSLDNSMYCLRCACEEAAQRLDSDPKMQSFSNRLTALSKTFETFQSKQSDHVSEVVNEFLPQDFRASFFKAARQHSERSNATALNDLVQSGGSVREKYKLLWEQQWKRRETLASVGNATGIWKWVVKYLAGVPEPLLQFAKDINSPKGPTEALRAKFGSALRQLSSFAIELNALCAVSVMANGMPDQDLADQLELSLACYEQEVQKFVNLLETVLTNSPFFVQPDQVAALKTENSR